MCARARVCVCACTCACGYFVCMCVSLLPGGDQGGNSIPTVPRNVSQEPVFCPSPTHAGEQSSFQLTAARVC